MTVNNYDLVKDFLPGQRLGLEDNGDHFLYTELLDRAKRKGNNGVRLVKRYVHRNLADFERHWPQMVQMCDQQKVRAYTRLATRSYESVGKLCAKNVLEAALARNWPHMRDAWGHACGNVTPEKKVWLWDVDDLTHPDYPLLKKFLGDDDYDLLLAEIPSKKGCHLVSKPFDVRLWQDAMRERGITSETQVHKDNPVNAYIPDEAA